ncbi:MAG: ABC transporter permease [Candidatus Peregrinibacteria bacterium]|nr:ABC transporter permease [Candidatus Peregrinibacteria bacterium]
MSTIYILWLRQLKRYSRSRARMIGSLGQPLLFLFALGFGFAPIYEKAGGGDYIQFIAPGVIGMSILFTAVLSGIEIIWERQFGFLKETMVAPVPRMHIMLGRTLGGATVAFIQGFVVFLITFLAGFRPESMLMVPLAFPFMFLIALLFTALGTGIACLLQDFQGFHLFMNFLVMPLFFLSGALFPLEGLPRPIAIMASLDPLSYGVDALRITLSGVGHFGLPVDITVLSLVTALFLGIGSYLFSRIQV